MARAKRWVLESRPVGAPRESDFRLEEVELAAPGEGEISLRVAYLSVDPYMRGLMRAGVKSYAPPIELGAVIVGGGVGEVVESRHPAFRPGDWAAGMTGWQNHVVAPGDGFMKVDPALAPVSTALGVLGMPGMTAYFGLLDVGRPQAGETVVVSGAAGAVGSLVGQIARIVGCRVVGIAGSDDNVRWLTGELGFDAAFNYKAVADYGAKLAELCPEGIDVYFDNVGGPITDAVLPLINQRARIAICGQISQYNSDQPPTGPRLLFYLLIRRARMEGFLVFDYAARYPEGLKQMATWLAEGRLKYREQFTEGIESVPRAFISMMEGANTGKMLVRL